MRRLALCGGTFDPFHLGHLRAPLSVISQFHWDQIIFIPAWRQPFKLGKKTTPALHRFAMAVLATNEDERLLVSPIEIERGDVSYTVETLRAFRAEHPDSAIDWIIGDDNLALLTEWKAIDEIFTLANFAVLGRTGGATVPSALRDRVRPPSERGSAGSICIAENVKFDVSSTEIRERMLSGTSIEQLVHPAVVRYINKNRLYSHTGVTT